MIILRLAFKSLWHRRVTALLTVASITMSVVLLLSIERIRRGAEESFENTIWGVDLLVGPRTGAVQLLLYSVFRIGNATNNISWESYEHFKRHPAVAWTIPLSLGDSHHEFRVVGTNHAFFRDYHYADGRRLKFEVGHPFEGLFDVVLGSDVASRLHYQIGSQLTLSHGIESTGILDHKDKPFSVVGILEKTGTPVDRSLHVSLEAIEAIHVDWQSGAPPAPGKETPAEQLLKRELKPTQITAFLVGLKSKLSIFQLQREINEYREEPLLAALPGATFQEIWKSLVVVESALILVSFCVVVAGLFGMLAALLTTLSERRREMALLRSVGARPYQIFCLLLGEAGLLAASGCAFGVILQYALLALARPLLETYFGLFVPLQWPTLQELEYLLVVVLLGGLIGLIPAWRAYRKSLADGLTMAI